MTENNKEALEPYKKLWSKIEKQIKAINSDKSIEYKNCFMKIRFDSYDDALRLDKILSFSDLNITVESVFLSNNFYRSYKW